VFEQARETHRAGDVERAKQLYARCIDEHHDPAAMHLLGFAEFQSSRFGLAIQWIEKAVGLRPQNAEYRNHLALACLADRQLAAARQHAEEARRLGHDDGHGYWHVGMEFVRRRDWPAAEACMHLGRLVQPASPEVHNCLGIVLAAQERYEAAETCYHQALECDPRSVEAMNNLGNALRDSNRVAESIPWYRRALALDPKFAAAHNNLGIALANLGNLDEALACYRRALTLQPGNADAMNNLANALRELGDHEAAIDAYQGALQLRAGSAEIQSNLGVAYRRTGRVDQAIGLFRRAIVLQPQSVKIHHHLATSLDETGQLPKAAACYRHLERIDPRPALWRLQGALLCPTVFASRDEMDAYWRSVPEELAAASASASEITFELADATNVLAAPPFNWQFHSGCIRQFKESFAAVFGPKLAAAFRSQRVASWTGPAGRPRVGFVVTEGHEGIFLKSMSGVLQRLRGFELIVFCSRREESRFQAVLTRDQLHVARLPVRFDQIVKTIDGASCDLLYYWEVGTDVSNYLLPFLRLAPIQLTSWGIQVTSGIANLDGYLSSRLVESPAAANQYSERLLLADTLLSYRDRTQTPAPPPRETFPLPPRANWYVCAQQLGKFHPDFDFVLADILRRDPQGIVVLTGDKHEINSKRLLERFRRVIPDVAVRIHLLPRLKASDYLGLIQQADVLLDPLHFGGVNSTYDGLSLGKAIVVLPSEFHRGRYALGCYRKMQLTDCVAQSVDDYVARAVRLATDGEYRRETEARVFQAGECLFADLAAVHEHERLFHELLSIRR
jgi:predicted O-linked N-acetylglucosamine transferase (SPINDLY family)